ncbi:MAG: Nif3-like dinuclear metal center hexameric protein [Terrimicrobiaceae bacterium]
MIPLADLTAYLDSALKISEFDDYPNALNGLQVENAGEVAKVAAAVDACEATILAAVEAGADLLLVHHGIFWGGLGAVTGPLYRKLRVAIENGLAIYSAHLPLDAHPEVGNNALLAEALGLRNHREPFLEVRGREIGVVVEATINREVLHSRLEAETHGRVVLAPGGPVSTSRIAIVSGGAGSEIGRVAAEGVDTFITGEGPHWCYTAAEELGVNLFLAGHYATETYGVKALAEHLAERFRLSWEFIDHPTGL